jgi:hypothetical protein
MPYKSYDPSSILERIHGHEFDHLTREQLINIVSEAVRHSRQTQVSTTITPAIGAECERVGQNIDKNRVTAQVMTVPSCSHVSAVRSAARQNIRLNPEMDALLRRHRDIMPQIEGDIVDEYETSDNEKPTSRQSHSVLNVPDDLMTVTNSNHNTYVARQQLNVHTEQQKAERIINLRNECHALLLLPIFNSNIEHEYLSTTANSIADWLVILNTKPSTATISHIELWKDKAQAQLRGMWEGVCINGMFNSQANSNNNNNSDTGEISNALPSLKRSLPEILQVEPLQGEPIAKKFVPLSESESIPSGDVPDNTSRNHEIDSDNINALLLEIGRQQISSFLKERESPRERSYKPDLKIPVFNGIKMSWQDWLFRFQAAMKSHRCPRRQWGEHMANYMIEAPLGVYQSLGSSYGEEIYHDFDKLIEKMSIHFVSEKHASRQKLQSYSVTMKTDMNQAMMELLRLARKAYPDYTNSTVQDLLMDKFLAMIPVEIRVRVEPLKRNEIIQEAAQLATEAEAVRQDILKQDSSSRLRQIERKIEESSPPPKVINPPKAAKGGNNKAPPPASTAKKAKPSTLCYNCQKKGHWAKDCRNPKVPRPSAQSTGPSVAPVQTFQNPLQGPSINTAVAPPAINWDQVWTAVAASGTKPPSHLNLPL